jgi:peptide-methionine (R)-S-oxide reductase
MLTWPDVLALAAHGNPPPPVRVERSADEWRARLSEEEFRVTREAGTERAFSHASCELFAPGRYQCTCCGTLLFDAGEKFDSGTGWPSFTQPVAADVIAYRSDDSYGMQRIETVCNVCDAHLGHVFPDGPRPSGLRYCMNGIALRKEATDQEANRPDPRRSA